MNAGFVFITIGTVTGRHLGVHREWNGLDLRSQDRLLPLYLGVLSGNDFPARLGRMAWTPDGVACGQRAGCSIITWVTHFGLQERVAAMKLALAGINHRTAPVAGARTSSPFGTEEIPAALAGHAAPGRKGSTHSFHLQSGRGHGRAGRWSATADILVEGI